MRCFLIYVLTVLAACPQPERPLCDVDERGYCRQPPHDSAPSLPRYSRRETIATETPVDGIQIEGSPAGYVSWTLAVRNDTDAAVEILWDASSFVTASGESEGRLVRGNTRKMDIANAQPPTPLAPHSHITHVVLAEQLAENENTQADDEAEYERARKIVTVDRGYTLRKRLTDLRKAEHRALIGAHLYLALRIDGDTRMWTGIVREPEREQGSGTLAKPGDE